MDATMELNGFSELSDFELEGVDGGLGLPAILWGLGIASSLVGGAYSLGYAMGEYAKAKGW